ncbi:MAG: hypothetical protein KDB80_08645, partial [Planctomycetes bacterium]|nr:hypothetical protein [Planctomycetota bacterium]
DLRRGGTVRVTVHGTPGSVGLLLLTTVRPGTGEDFAFGSLLVGAPFVPIPVGFDAAGSWTAAVPLPDHPLIVGWPLHLQSFDFGSTEISELESVVVGE